MALSTLSSRPYRLPSTFPTIKMWRRPTVQALNQLSKYQSHCKRRTLTATTTTSKKKPSEIHAARPPDDKTSDFESKFPLPDKEKELEIGRLQSHVVDLHKAGNYRQALKVAQDLLKVSEAHFSSLHPATASAYNNLGLMHKLLGDFDESRKQYRQALKIYKQTVGVDHASYASILHNLGTLNRTQIHLDTSLRATDRLSLLEESLEYLEQAYEVRLNEMGKEHPHTVASRSSWGSTLAAQILHRYKLTQKEGTKFYVSVLPDAVSQQGWDAAQEHLRHALQTAIENPRGAGLHSNKKRSKKTMQTAQKKDSIQTLSGASAAQNLAIFLKARATTSQPYDAALLEEAEKLYRDVLAVRTQLQPAQHPDVYACKHSLAELLEAKGDEEAANAIRQEIVDTYDPPKEGESGKD